MNKFAEIKRKTDELVEEMNDIEKKIAKTKRKTDEHIEKMNDVETKIAETKREIDVQNAATEVIRQLLAPRSLHS